MWLFGFVWLYDHCSPKTLDECLRQNPLPSVAKVERFVVFYSPVLIIFLKTFTLKVAEFYNT